MVQHQHQQQPVVRIIICVIRCLQLQLLIVIDIVFQTKTKAHFLDVPNLVKVSKNEEQLRRLMRRQLADCR